MFGTRGSLILNIAIASYSITHFSILFIYFILQVKQSLEKSQGVPPTPHQTAINVVKQKPLKVGVSQSPKRGLRKNYRAFPSFIFCDFDSDKDSTHLPLSPPRLAISTINIPDGRGFRLAQAIRAMERQFSDVMLMTESKIKLEAYSLNRLSYYVTCSTACLSSTKVSESGVGMVIR